MNAKKKAGARRRKRDESKKKRKKKKKGKRKHRSGDPWGFRRRRDLSRACAGVGGNNNEPDVAVRRGKVDDPTR